MRNVICCWWGGGPPDGFEKNVPVYFSGLRNLRLGFTNSIDILFLSGYELLSDNYKSKLKDVGYRLHDLNVVYCDLCKQYPGIKRFNDYENKCLMRWLVISSYLAGEPIIHYDGDVVFNEDPAVIAKSLRGRTFVLQGCPALAAISDRAWFSQYQEQLAIFLNDIAGYSATAWGERAGWEISDREKWAGSRLRETISSDQDFISHLIHTDRIVQDKPSEILKDLGSYLVFENPLYMHCYGNNLQHATYSRDADIDYIDRKRVLFWHMQNGFVHYLGKFIFRRKYLRRSRLRMSYDAEKKDIDSYLYSLYLRYKTHYRLHIYKYFFDEKDFSDVMNDRSWWQEGVFA